MYFDALTLTAVADELRTTLLGGRIQRVLLPTPLSVGLEVYAQKQRYHLLASAHSRFARVHLVSQKLSRGVEQHTPMLLLLRKYVLAGRIIAIEQPTLERILVISIVKEMRTRNHPENEIAPDAVDADAEAEQIAAEEDAAAGSTRPVDPDKILRCELIIEPMERRSNIILVDDNNIVLESVKRVTPRMSQRVIMPRHAYELPPGQTKRDPRTVTATGIAALPEETGERKLTRAIVAGYRGVSPQVAREVVQRTIGEPEAALPATLPWYTLAAHLRQLYTTPPEPSLVVGTEGPVAYAPYLLTHLDGAEPQTSMNVALETFYVDQETVTAHQRYRESVQQQLQATRERLQRRQRQLATEMEHARKLEHLRWEGEMLFAFLHTLSPGQSTLDVEGQTITINPDQTPVEAAQARFRAYDKAKSALDDLPTRIAQTDTELAGLDQLLALLEGTDEREQIEQLAAEAQEQGYLRPAAEGSGKRRRGKRVKPLHLVSSDGFDLYVGRSSNQNAEVTFRIGRPEDLWLHVRGIPGSHVIIRTDGREVPEQTLEEAAGLAAYFSPVREEALVEIDLSRRSQVRKIAGGAPGLVTYRAERTLRVAPRPPWK